MILKLVCAYAPFLVLASVWTRSPRHHFDMLLTPRSVIKRLSGNLCLIQGQSVTLPPTNFFKVVSQWNIFRAMGLKIAPQECHQLIGDALFLLLFLPSCVGLCSVVWFAWMFFFGNLLVSKVCSQHGSCVSSGKAFSYSRLIIYFRWLLQFLVLEKLSATDVA